MVTGKRFGDVNTRHGNSGGDPGTDGLGDGTHSDERGVTSIARDPVARRARLVPDRSHRPTVRNDPDNEMTDRGLQVRRS